LATTDDARVHCAVLKMRAVPVVPARRVRSGPGRGAAAEATVPSGPNSVLDPGVLLVGVPSRKRAY